MEIRMVYPFLFFFSVMALLVLPLAPAVREWRRKTDSQPLRVVREYDGDIMYFANSFRRFLSDTFTNVFIGDDSSENNSKFHLEDRSS